MASDAKVHWLDFGPDGRLCLRTAEASAGRAGTVLLRSQQYQGYAAAGQVRRRETQAAGRQAAERGRGSAIPERGQKPGLPVQHRPVERSEAKTEPVDSDRIFRKGECFVLHFEANRSGYLYVLAKESDGTWMPLVPNAQMPDEKNVVDPGQKMRVPAEYCFKVEDPPGSETLFVVLSRDPRDVYELNEAIRSSAAPAAREGFGAGPDRERPDQQGRRRVFTVQRNAESLVSEDQRPAAGPTGIAVLEIRGEFVGAAGVEGGRADRDPASIGKSLRRQECRRGRQRVPAPQRLSVWRASLRLCSSPPSGSG